MHPRLPVPAAVVRLALHQGGVVTREQAVGLGLSRHVIARLVNSDTWRRVSRGVLYTAPGEPPWDALAWAGILVGGQPARLGPEASGHIYGLRPEPPMPVDILVPAGAHVMRAGPWRFHREMPDVHSAQTVGSPPRLTVEDTVLDLAGAGTDGDAVTLVTDALRLRLTTPSRLRAALERRARHPRRRLLTDLLADADGIESGLELAYLRDVERAHDLPRATRQGGRPDLPYRTDVEYEDYGLLVELDGRRGHEGVGRFRDMNRDNRHVLRGKPTLRYGWWDVTERPCEVACQVFLALAQRGYQQIFGRCRRCSVVPEANLVNLAG